MYNCLILLLALVFIVISSELFCNALEHFGAKLGVSEGVTGSIFAAVATAMPETIIPILAIASHNSGSTNGEIAVGAILGAPLMLSTLSLFLMALSVLRKRGLKGLVKAESSGLQRDLKFFFIGYGLAFVAIFVQGLKLHYLFNCAIALALGFSYFMYILITVKESSRLVLDGHHTKAEAKLFLSHFGLKVNLYIIVIQLIMATMMLIYFAEMFIDSVNSVATLYNISSFLLALIIIPIATELPEKINSILWLRRGKDTLALGNITGAMVFQGTLLPIVGVLFTDWKLTSPIYLFGIGVTSIATLWIYFNARRSGGIRVWHFGVNGLLYVINLGMCAYFFYR